MVLQRILDQLATTFIDLSRPGLWPEGLRQPLNAKIRQEAGA